MVESPIATDKGIQKMTQKVEFLYDFGSPNAYYSHCVIPEIEARHDVKFEYVPILLGGIFKATNNVSPAVSLSGIPNKAAYTRVETARWLARYPVETFRQNPYFPVNTLMIMRGATYARDKDYYPDYVRAIFHAMWADGKKMDDPEVVVQTLRDNSLPAEEIFAGAQDPEVKAALIAATDQGVKRGAFGSPTFLVDEDMYFGKETLRDIEERLEQTLEERRNEV